MVTVHSLIAHRNGDLRLFIRVKVAVGDFNGDGWLDIYVTSAGPQSGAAPCGHKLYRNNGDKTFTNVAVQAGVNCTTFGSQDGLGAGFGDYDLDGDLDLFVAGFANNNDGSKLFRNNGDETFTDVTDLIGFFNGTPINLRSFAPRFADMDGDFYPEMLLASDFGTSRYFLNNTNGTFSDITDSAGTGLDENGMGQTIGDFNGDGLLDWYVTSIFLPQNNWTGNKLYINLGNHVYNEIAALAGVNDGGYGWGAVSVDFNNDGLLDIAETNGDSSASSQFFNEQSYLWKNNGNNSFTEMALSSGLVHFGKGRGMVNFDYDNDGDQDVVIFGNDENVRLYRNDISGNNTNWLRVFLDTSNQPILAPNGIGSRVIVTIGGQSQMRYITSGDNFLSHSELSAHFGLGASTIIDELRVEWSNGNITVLTDVAANQTINVMAEAGSTLAKFRINAGGSNFTDSNGNLFVADKAFTPGGFGYAHGSTFALHGDVTGTVDDDLYLNIRWIIGHPFRYSFDNLPDGNYDITLYFVEPDPVTTGQRVFDVKINNVVTLSGFDIITESGGQMVAHSITQMVTNSGGRLDIDFIPITNNAVILSAIEVVQIAP